MFTRKTISITKSTKCLVTPCPTITSEHEVYRWETIALVITKNELKTTRYIANGNSSQLKWTTEVKIVPVSNKL